MIDVTGGLLVLILGSQMELFRRIGGITNAIKTLEETVKKIQEKIGGK